MKSFALLLSILMLPMIGTAAALNWTAGGVNGSVTTGVTSDWNAYLLELPINSDVTRDAIADYISTVGLVAPSETDIVMKESATITEIDGYWDATYDRLNPVQGDPSANAYLVLILSPDKSKFILSQIESGVLDPSGTFATIYFNTSAAENYTEDYWGAVADVGGGTVDPDVPEPTALALLALGVAGVALRRRVV